LGVGSGFWVQGFRVQGSGFKVQGSRFRVQGSGFKVQGSRFWVLGSAPPLAVSVQSNQKRNSGKANIEYRIMNIECRSIEFCLFYKKRLSEANPPFDIRYSIFCGSAVRF
jgi:hypothetical protein